MREKKDSSAFNEEHGFYYRKYIHPLYGETHEWSETENGKKGFLIRADYRDSFLLRSSKERTLAEMPEEKQRTFLRASMEAAYTWCMLANAKEGTNLQ